MDTGLSLTMKQRGAAAGGGTPPPWYLAGGVDPSNCVVAYQAKGAADYATSLVNLANPGTNNLGVNNSYYDIGTGFDFDTSSGWIGYGEESPDTPYLWTGYVPANPGHDMSVICRIKSDVVKPNITWWPFGQWEEHAYTIEIDNNQNKITFYNGNYEGGLVFSDFTAPLSDAVLAIAGKTAYFNGIYAGIIGANDLEGMWDVAIGTVAGDPVNSGVWYTYHAHVICAISFYNTTLTAEQVAAITTAMQAL